MVKRSGFVSNSSSSSFIIQAHPQYKAKELTEEYIRTKILDPDIKLEYEFSNSILSAMISPVFSHLSGALVDAFVKEADRRYA